MFQAPSQAFEEDYKVAYLRVFSFAAWKKGHNPSGAIFQNSINFFGLATPGPGPVHKSSGYGGVVWGFPTVFAPRWAPPTPLPSRPQPWRRRQQPEALNRQRSCVCGGRTHRQRTAQGIVGGRSAEFLTPNGAKPKLGVMRRISLAENCIAEIDWSQNK